MQDGSIPVSVMQFGRDEAVVEHTIVDLGRIWSLLESEGMIPLNMFHAVRYRDIESGPSVELIRRLVETVMADDISASIHIRSHMFRVLATYKMTSTGDFIREVRGFATNNTVICCLSDDALTALYKQALSVRNGVGIAARLVPPDVLWLPAKYHPSFEGAHAISDRELRFCGSGIFLCPPTYYFQIVWHESCHLLFRCADCYDLFTRRRSCELENCVMQWEPCKCNPDQADWLCEKQKAAVREGARRLNERRDTLTR
jgi:hypothetical protein